MRPRVTFAPFATFATFVACLALLPACEGDAPAPDGNLTLLVELKTDLVPGIEFAAVRTQLFDPADRTDELSRREVDVTLGRDLTTGRRVAELGDLSVGTYLVRVSLLSLEDAEVLRRDVIVTVRETAGITVLMTRDCVGVVCPGAGDNPTEKACLDGRCIDERCTPQTAEYCPAPTCTTASTCTDMHSPCATPACEDGACFLRADSTLCLAEEYCDPSDGCLSLPLSTNARDAYLKASNTESASQFGVSVSLSADGRTLAVGASGESAGASESGAVYVFVWDAGGWSQQEHLPSPRPSAGARFGHSVSLSADGNDLAVGAWDLTSGDAGTVYVFTRNDATWSLDDTIDASNPGITDFFGISVSLSGDGLRLAVGAAGEASSATGIDGDQGDNSAPSAGAVYVFVQEGGAWRQETYLKASNTGDGDGFGWSVALNEDGSVLAVGAAHEDSEQTGIGGDGADDSSVQSGAVYVFGQLGGAWTQEVYLKASNTGTGDAFGQAVSLSGDGATLAVGAPGEGSSMGGGELDDSSGDAGAVYLFSRNVDVWTQEAFLKASNTDIGDTFGASVALSTDGTTLIVGAPDEASGAMGSDADEADNSAPGAGAAYAFVDASGAWSQAAYVKASYAEENDRFGMSVSVTENGAWFVVGAPGERSSATGINGDESNNETTEAGAAYSFSQ